MTQQKYPPRYVDELGRVVLPLELRKQLDITGKQQVDITLDGDKIILQKSIQK